MNTTLQFDPQSMEMPNTLHGFSLLYHLLHSFILFLLPKNLRPPPLFPTPPAEAGKSNHRRNPSDLRRVFDTFDENKDGRITKIELASSIRRMGIEISDAELARVIEKVDVNGDECVDVDEFEALYKMLLEGGGGEGAVEEEVGGGGELEAVFGVFDKDGDGFISEEELKCVLESIGLGQGRSLEECRRMIREVDVDGDGRVNLMEFQLMMKDVAFAT